VPTPRKLESARHDVAQDLLRHAADAILTLDRDHLITSWNHGAEVLTAWSIDEVLEQPSTIFDLEDDLHRAAADVLSTHQPVAVESQWRHRSGVSVPVACQVSPLIAADGSCYGVGVIARDRSATVALHDQLRASRREVHARFHESVVPQVTMGPDGRIMALNPAALRLGGWRSEADLLGRPASDFLPLDAPGAHAARVADLAAGAVPRTAHVHQLRTSQGQLLDAKVTAFGVHDENGRLERIEAVIEDVSAAVAAQRALAASEERWRLLAIHSSDVALLCDEQAVVQFVSPAVVAQFGYELHELQGADGFAFFHPDDEPSVRARWAQALEHPGEPISFEARVRAADGNWRWVEETATNQLDVPGVAAVVVNIVDVHERRHAQAVLLDVRGQDPLTGLASRERILAGLDTALSNAPHATAVVVLDLSRFKVINATHGHRVGDDVLRAIGQRLSDHSFEGEIVARLSGARFAVAVEGPDTLEGLAGRARDLQTAIALPLRIGELTLSVAAAAGGAHGPARDAGELLQAAETAVHEAQRDLAHPLRVVSAQHRSSAMERALLVEDLRRGLDSEEFVVQYQPILDLRDGRVAGAEALVRWDHPTRGLLAPGAFLDVAEDSGLIVELGRQVLAQACAASARWNRHRTSDQPFHVAVNLSAKQLVVPDAVDDIRRSLLDAGAPPASLMVEVTETAVMADLDATSTTLERLRDLGVAVAVDDFGTGYSSLTYVKRFPVTTLKVDRSFVTGVDQDTDDAAIVASVVNLAHAVRLDCIAEGVETHAQRAVLQALGCGYAQGFLWAPPMTADAFDRWSEKHDPSSVLQPLEPQSTRPRVRRRAAKASAQVVARVATLQAQGASLHTIAAALNSEGLHTPDGRRWHPRSVARLVSQHIAT